MVLLWWCVGCAWVIRWDDYPTDAVVSYFLSDPAAWDFGSLTLDTFWIEDIRYVATSNGTAVSDSAARTGLHP